LTLIFKHQFLLSNKLVAANAAFQPQRAIGIQVPRKRLLEKHASRRQVQGFGFSSARSRLQIHSSDPQRNYRPLIIGFTSNTKRPNADAIKRAPANWIKAALRVLRLAFVSPWVT